MPLRIIRRKSTGALTISGTVGDQRIRRRAQSNDLGLAREEAAALEADLLRTAWHGERRGTRSFPEAARSYLDAAPRSENQQARVARLLRVIGDTRLGTIDQQTAIRLRERMMRPGASARAYSDAVLMPMRAILHHAARLGWCSVPYLETPRGAPGRTLFLLPDEAERLIAAAAPHLRPLLVFLIGTGARMAEALELEWRDVDLAGARAILWRTKTGRRRDVALQPRVIETLATLPHREGSVFRTGRGQPYTDRGRRQGGQILNGWRGARRRAGLDPKLTPHDCRHTWASWHYALHRDLLALKLEGGWSSVALVERYAHLLPAGHESAIREFLGWHQAGTEKVTLSVTP